jgi:hypothetical protein
VPGMPDMRVFKKLVRPDGTITRNDLVGDWGWWDGSKFRTKVFAVRTRVDLDVATGFSALMVAPPPYGNWLPALDMNLRAGLLL